MTELRSLSSFFETYDEIPTGSSLEDIFAEEPVDLNTFIQDKKFLGQKNISLSDVQADAVHHIERIYYPDLYPLMAAEWNSEYWAQPVRLTNLITLQWGKGSGKDAIARWASLRIAYLLLCLKSPQEYYEMPDSDSIHLLNIAANSGQANRAFFKPMTEAVKRGWFKDKAEPKQGMIQYEKNVEAVSGHSDAEGQEGLNLMLGVADEIDAFKARDEMVGLGKKAREASTSAESILDMLKSSASTRFPETYKRVSISYPRYKGSTIQKLTVEARESNERYGAKSQHFVSGPLATWDVNPRIKGKHQYQEDYDKDPDGAAAKYECKPQRSSDAYFRNMPAFRHAVTEDNQPIEVDYKLVDYVSEHTGAVTPVWHPVYTFDPNFRAVQGAIYAMHGDLAINGDRAGIAMSHVESWKERKTTMTRPDGEVYEEVEILPVIKNDFTIYFSSSIATVPAREIQIGWARELCFELRKMGFLITRFTFDGFQSSDSMQILTNNGIESKRVSMDLNDDGYKALRDVTYDDRLHMPDNDLLFKELEGLSRVNGKVDHPPGGSKDLADALAGSVLGAIEVGGEEDEYGSMVEAGDSSFAIGMAMQELLGYEDQGFSYGSGMELPIGMSGGGFSGY